MPVDPLRGAAAIVGVAESDLGEVGPDRFAIELAAQASLRALAEAGLTTKDVDGLFGVVGDRRMSTLDLAEYLGIRPRYSDNTMIGGSACVAHLHHAAVALQAGECDVALIAYANTPLADRKRGSARALALEEPDYEHAYTPVRTISGYALAAARHMHEYGTTREQLAQVAVAARQWAMLNPQAFKRDPLSIEDVLSSRVVSSPLSVLDCCLVTDGGGAAVLVRRERASDLSRSPVYVLGAAEAHWHKAISQMPDLTVTATVESAARAFAMAQVTPADVDIVQLYDAFTINVVLFLEDLGFCEKGEGGAFVSDGRIAPGGQLAVNTNGGGLSYCHPGMYGIFTIIEAVRQLQGGAGDRQQAAPNIAIAHGNGGQLSSQATAVLGTGAVL